MAYIHIRMHTFVLIHIKSEFLVNHDFNKIVRMSKTLKLCTENTKHKTKCRYINKVGKKLLEQRNERTKGN